MDDLLKQSMMYARPVSSFNALLSAEVRQISDGPPAVSATDVDPPPAAHPAIMVVQHLSIARQCDIHSPMLPPSPHCGFLSQSAHAHAPGAQGHSPSSPPQLHFVLPFVPGTVLISASAGVLVVLETCAFLGHDVQLHLPGSQGQLSVEPPQPQMVLSLPGRC